MIVFDWNENPAHLGFTYLWFLRDSTERNSPTLFPIMWVVGLLGSVLHFLLWSVGLFVLAKRAFNKKLIGSERLVSAMVIGWQFAPMPFLSFFNYHVMMDEVKSLVSLRYYLITFPAAFLISGVGFGHLFALVGSRWKAWLVTIPVYLVAVYSIFVFMHLSLLNRTGIALPYLNFHAPSLQRMLQLREILLGDLKLTVDDYYERVTAQNVLLPHMGETSLDFLITQDVRAYTNPGLPPNQHVIIFSQPFDAPVGPPPPETMTVRFPVHEDGQTQPVLHEMELGYLRIYVMEGTVPGVYPFDPVMKRNGYYQHERMKYLRLRPLPSKHSQD